MPDGYAVGEMEDPASVVEIDPERTALGDQSQRFWTEFLDDYLELDDPEQPKPKPARATSGCAMSRARRASRSWKSNRVNSRSPEAIGMVVDRRTSA